MNRPYILCHMMMSLDGRIDCGMTIQLPGNNKYYSALNALDAPTRVSGRVTAATEMTSGQEFKSTSNKAVDKECFAKNIDAISYNIVVDTKGTLLWDREDGGSQPHLIIMSEQASVGYLEYLDKQGISWITAGEKKVDLTRAMEILNEQFGIKRLAVVGGGKINGGFLQAGLIDEVSVVIGAGIDGRIGQPSLFDGRPDDSHPLSLQLKDMQTYPDDGTVWLRYTVK